jgi:hypothetical protein
MEIGIQFGSPLYIYIYIAKPDQSLACIDLTMADLKKKILKAKAKAKMKARAKQRLEGKKGKKGKKVKMAKKPRASKAQRIEEAEHRRRIKELRDAAKQRLEGEDPPAEGSSDWEEDDLTPATAPAPDDANKDAEPPRPSKAPSIEEADENEEVRDLDHLEELLGGDTQCWEETP